MATAAAAGAGAGAEEEEDDEDEDEEEADPPASNSTNLPREVVEMILDYAAEAEDIIEVCFTRIPTLRRRPSENPEYIIWKYVCQAWNPSPLLELDRASRAQYLENKPDVLQVNRGPLLHYNAAQDTVYFDSASFLNLWHYVYIHRWQFGKTRRTTGVPRGNLRGFYRIQTLGWFEDDNTNLDIQGFAHLRDPQERVLTGLTNIRLLGTRGYHPGGRPPAPGWPLERRLKRTIRDKVRALRNLANWRQDQLDLIQEERGFVDADVDEFWDDNSTPFNLALPVA
ncbi:hypothetical protein L207DRAFT_591684 [Hyaloscypha variabilis F]|uniref:Uncharacterized protein n=1 Tax=Hyaloscypha variabilis (strain UAMH 11265 / GT02V1 / F) TaxID=1149755 RepID=A0A2J6QY66_HYAVF|nr:hypothetical protein L207DRAFT_591684 [Hyaloscypha variabilis F]